MANYEMRGVCHICKMTDVEEHDFFKKQAI